MKIVMLIGDMPHHKALAAKVHACFPLEAVIVERKKASAVTTSDFKTILNKLLDRTLFFPIGRSWQKLMAFYQSMGNNLLNKLVPVENVNSKEVEKILADLKPDLVLVSGTRMIKQPILSIPVTIGIMNLHTGLSPYIKGGPNCTNWCIAQNIPQLIGNTIMWIDAGIDSGDILSTETTSLTGDESLYDLHLKVMEHAHALYIKCIAYVLSNPHNHNGVAQRQIAEGRIFYTRMWTFKNKLRLLLNFYGGSYKAQVKSREQYLQQQHIICVSLS